MIDSAVAGGVAVVAKEVLSPIVKEFAEKYLKQMLAVSGAKRLLSASLKRYLNLLDARTKFIPSIAIQGSQFELESIYEPLTLVRSSLANEIRVEGFPRNLLRPQSRVLVVDSAGMGKSTLTKYIARSALVERTYFPIIVELRRVRAEQRVLEFLIEEILGSGLSDTTRDQLKKTFETGGFLFVFDGYDEVDEKGRARINLEIGALAREFPINSFVLTSRPEDGLAALQDFASYSIKPLSLEQAFSLLKRYDIRRGKAAALIEKVKANGQIHAFLGNPLLVTLLYKAFDYKATIPLKRGIFYRQVFDALYQDHDLSKEGAYERRKRSNLDCEDFHRFLRSLGIVTFRLGRIQYERSQFEEQLKSAYRIFRRPEMNLVDIARDLQSAVPVFVKDGTDIRWSHKTFQEYFASQFIVTDLDRDQAKQILREVVSGNNPGRFETLLELTSEVDPTLLREAYILEHFQLLKEQFATLGRSATEASFASYYLGRLAESYIVKVPSAKGGAVFEACTSLLNQKLTDSGGGRSVATMTEYPGGYGVVSIHSKEWERAILLSTADGEAFKSAAILMTPVDFEPFTTLHDGLGEGWEASLNELAENSTDPDLRMEAVRLMCQVFPGGIPSLCTVNQLLSTDVVGERIAALEELVLRTKGSSSQV